MIWKIKLTLIAALVAAYPLHVWAATGAKAQHGNRATGHNKQCPSAIDLTVALSKASNSLAQAQYPPAIETLQTLAEQGCDPRASLLLAAAYEENDDLPRAEQTLRVAQSAWPGETSIATSLAREYMSEGRREEAAEALNHFHATTATPWQEIQLSVVILLANHRLAPAEALAQLGFKVYPSIDSLLLLANSLQLEGRYKDVIALLDGKRSTYPNSAKFLVTLAESEFDASIYDIARSDAERAITLDDSLYQAHYLLGNILLQQGEAEAAIEQYRAALQRAPDQPRTYYHLALALRATHAEAEEEGLLSKALELDDHYALAHCEMGRILLNQSRAPEAVAQLELAVEENASSEEAYSLLARAYDRAGEKEKAEAIAKRLVAVRKANHQSQPIPAKKTAGKTIP
jgi:tetratricopeptide (TPR) repeat protein